MDREIETTINRLMSDLKAAQDLSAYLAANNKKLREALAFYAKGQNWEVKWINGFLTSESKPTTYEDRGEIARNALKDGE